MMNFKQIKQCVHYFIDSLSLICYNCITKLLCKSFIFVLNDVLMRLPYHHMFLYPYYIICNISKLDHNCNTYQLLQMVLYPSILICTAQRSREGVLLAVLAIALHSLGTILLSLHATFVFPASHPLCSLWPQTPGRGDPDTALRQ